MIVEEEIREFDSLWQNTNEFVEVYEYQKDCRKKKKNVEKHTDPPACAIFTALLLGTRAICFVLRSIDENGSFTLLIFVLAVVIISRFTEGYFWGVFSSLFGVICVNFVFTYPSGRSTSGSPAIR